MDLGHCKREILAHLKGLGLEVQHKKIKGGEEHIAVSDRFRIKIYLEDNWIGLEFDLKNSRLAYHIDTDLYDVHAEENQWFVKEITEDITNFLDSFKDRKVLISKTDRPVLIVPVEDKYVVLKQGILFPSYATVESVDKLKSKHNFVQLEWLAEGRSNGG